MLNKKIRCSIVSRNYITVDTYPQEVGIQVEEDGVPSYVFLTPKSAQALRKQLKEAIECLNAV